MIREFTIRTCNAIMVSCLVGVSTAHADVPKPPITEEAPSEENDQAAPKLPIPFPLLHTLLDPAKHPLDLWTDYPVEQCAFDYVRCLNPEAKTPEVELPNDAILLASDLPLAERLRQLFREIEAHELRASQIEEQLTNLNCELKELLLQRRGEAADERLRWIKERIEQLEHERISLDILIDQASDTFLSLEKYVYTLTPSGDVKYCRQIFAGCALYKIAESNLRS